MNDFGVNLKGCRGVLKGQTFYKYTVVKGVVKPCPEKERVFVLESGKGLEPDGTNRSIFGHLELDGFKGTISSYDLETVIMPNGKRIKPLVTGDPPPEPPVPMVETVDEAEEAQKPVRRKR